MLQNVIRWGGVIDILCQMAAALNDIRNWWRSEDEQGIPALERIKMRLPLRRRLLRRVDFGRFPPATMYVKGFPLQLWEALVASIDAKSQLYALSLNGTYNVRAFSSLMGETFFSELTHQDKRGHGTLTCEEFAQFLGKATEQMQTRLDSVRCFAYRTASKTVYNLVGTARHVGPDIQQDVNGSTNVQSKAGVNVIRRIAPRNHFFDTQDRRRGHSKTKETWISRDRNAIQKGALGVRWEGARVNLAKMLPTDRMGLSDQIVDSIVP